MVVAGTDVMTYAVIGAPPFELGAVQDRTTLAFPAVAVRLEGASGTFATKVLLDTIALEPMSLTELILNVYDVPFVRSAIIEGLFGDVSLRPRAVHEST